MSMIPEKLVSALRVDPKLGADKRLVIPFAREEILVNHGVVNRIEFREKKCNVTLKNSTSKNQGVNVRIFVLNRALIQLWAQAENWWTAMTPDQAHLISWDFAPVVPDVVWNEKARSDEPSWIVVDSLG